ncbi:MAG: hypothetical protein ACRDI3_02445 [Actinomycetota bacterium]
MAGLLQGGPTAALSHRTAAREWRWDPFTDWQQIEIIVDRDLRSSSATRFIQAKLGAKEVGSLRQMRITSPIRTVLDLATVATEEELEIALDCGLVRTGLRIDRLRQALDERGRKGPRVPEP